MSDEWVEPAFADACTVADGLNPSHHACIFGHVQGVMVTHKILVARHSQQKYGGQHSMCFCIENCSTLARAVKEKMVQLMGKKVLAVIEDGGDTLALNTTQVTNVDAMCYIHQEMESGNFTRSEQENSRCSVRVGRASRRALHHVYVGAARHGHVHRTVV